MNLDQLKVVYRPADIPLVVPAADQAGRTYVMDKVLDHQFRDGQLRYHVQWKDGTSSWEPSAHVDDPAAVNTYFKSVAVAPVKPKRAAKSRGTSKVPIDSDEDE